MTKKALFIGLISLFFLSFTSCFGEEEKGAKITLITKTFEMDENGRISITFTVDPPATDASKMIVGLREEPKLLSTDPDVTELYPTIESVTPSITGVGKWTAMIKLVKKDGSEFHPDSRYEYSLESTMCLMISAKSYSEFLKLTYTFPKK